jgi:hypothetical protein
MIAMRAVRHLLGSQADAHSFTQTHEHSLPQVKSRSSDPLGAARRTKVMPMK